VPRATRPWRAGGAAFVLVLLLSEAAPAAPRPDASAMPHLQRRHGAIQLIVDGQPFLLRAGELENSSASSLPYLDKLWPRFEAMHLNALLAPVYWNLVEPRQGHFDFGTVDGLVDGARAHHMRLVLLWFGSWKNSMSSYAPAWVKRDAGRYPRARRADGTPMEILSALGGASLQADSRAFAALMEHLKRTDGERHTVVMVQVENEVGMILEARDHGAPADAAFHAPVPAALTDYLSRHRHGLAPALEAAWRAHGFKAGADWEATFGAGPQTDELFTAWTEARYTGKVAAAGKAIYPLPMYVNAALIRPGKRPGQYPSGGPLPHLFDVWRAAAPAIDMPAPDIYFPNFLAWGEKYAHPGAPFFIPETGRVSGAQMAANGFYAYAQWGAMGYSPYAPEFLSVADAQALGQAYGVIAQLTPLILASQGNAKMIGLLPRTRFDGSVAPGPQTFDLGDYTMTVRFDEPEAASTGASDDAGSATAPGGLVIQAGPDDFWFAGTGLTVYFAPRGKDHAAAGIDAIREGRFENGRWLQGREMNGDDTNQGRFLRLPGDGFSIRRVTLYRYD
jgi:beta-galactosidase GanA